MVVPVSYSQEVHSHQTEENHKGSPHHKIEGKLETHSISLLSNLFKYTGVIALITAIGSLILCQEEDDSTKKFKLGHCLGSCYVLAEINLIFTAVSYIALNILLKLNRI